MPQAISPTGTKTETRVRGGGEQKHRLPVAHFPGSRQYKVMY